ncbi:MAG: PD-(D/E)XK nuclease family protein [Muribaculaceae bacterium]|nr:PD-(D/E)XK nuclease family protein [Muribaculaceae bacterium]
MKPFLQEIAEYYLSRCGSRIIDYCFVFPNKRAGVFFNHYLAEAARATGTPLIHPEVMTVSDFVTDMTDLVEASRIEQLLILYRCYREIMAEQTPEGAEPEHVDFNKFQFWGDILLNDFTDVDKYLVNPAEIFHNIESLKEISANYLTPEQIDVIKRYWGDEKAPKGVAEFWNHAVHVSDTSNHGKRVSTASFIKLWQVMNELYVKFNNVIAERGLAYQGMLYRRAYDLLKDTNAESLPYERYVFIGFNVLSTVEEKIFAVMRDKRMADFFWDYASPAFDDTHNRATRFLKQYVLDFPSPADAQFARHKLENWPDIRIIAVPTTIGETKVVSGVVKKLLDKQTDNTSQTLLSTAIVLPDENLCIPMVNSLPPSITDINVTMGYPMRYTPVSSLMSAIGSMQMRSRKLRYENAYFRDDVIQVLSHPLIRSISSSTCDQINKAITDNRLFNVPLSLLSEPRFEALRPLFALAPDYRSCRQVFDYLRELAGWLLGAVRNLYIQPVTTDDEVDEVVDDDEVEDSYSAIGAIEIGFLKHYIATLDELQRLQAMHLDDLNVEMSDSTVFHLVERLMAGENVTFEGRPLKGLQVMGMLETRAIDFETVIITSMNERIFPRKHFAKSFIPPALRKGYGMATIDHQESISAYYFYRLISRARTVFMLYDSSTRGTSSGEPSRYINQLRYLYRPDTLIDMTAGYNLHVSDDYDVSLKLDSDRRAILAGYLQDREYRSLSATAINTYINCPFQFALSYIEGYHERDDVKDYFDEATYGLVVHQVAENLYKSLQVDDKPVLINRATINRLRRPEVIMPEIHRAINTHFLKRDGKDLTTLPADADIIARIIYHMVNNMLGHELDEYDCFTFISGEKKERVMLRISDRLVINFNYTIDRIDMVTRRDGKHILRIIDYKTGSDSLEADVDLLFESSSREMRNKAVLQLFLYCSAFLQKHPEYDRDDILVQPLIYKFKTIGQNLPLQPIKFDGEPLIDFKAYSDEVFARLDEILYPLFDGSDSDIEFKCADDDHVCKYCKFTTICLRNLQ